MPRDINGFSAFASVPARRKPTLLTGQGSIFRGTLDENGLVHECSWKVGIEDLPAFLNYAWGWTTTTTTTNGTTTTTSTRGPRLGSPYFPGTVATGVSFEGVGADGPINPARPFSHARVAVRFGWLPFGTDGSQPYVDVRWRGKSTLATIPNARTQFSNGEMLDFDSGVWLGSVSVEVTLHQLVNWQTSLAILMGLMGKVSSDAVTLDGFACSAGTLMMPTFDAAKSVASMGSPQQTLTIPLEYRSLPWNQAIRSDGVADTVSPAPYVTGAFTPLLSIS